MLCAALMPGLEAASVAKGLVGAHKVVLADVEMNQLAPPPPPAYLSERLLFTSQQINDIENTASYLTYYDFGAYYFWNWQYWWVMEPLNAVAKPSMRLLTIPCALCAGI